MNSTRKTATHAIKYFIGPSGLPRNIGVSDVTSTSFVVLWDEADDTDWYNISWWIEGCRGRENIITSLTSCIITGLVPNTTYHVRITTLNSCRLGSAGYTFAITTLMIGSVIPMMSTTPNSFTMCSFTTARPTGSRITLCKYYISLTNM